jgi:hypothetical protein
MEQELRFRKVDLAWQWAYLSSPARIGHTFNIGHTSSNAEDIILAPLDRGI